MSDDEAIWEQRDGEPHNWYSRFLAFRDMGPGRSLLGAVNAERVKKGQNRTNNLATSWREACKQWEWRKRAEAWDDEQQRIALASTKYALVSERVKLLDRWASTQDTIMLADVEEKGYARADSMEQLRGLLDDLAKETGGRVKVTKSDANVSLDVQGATDRLLQKLEALPDDDDDTSAE